LESTAKWSPASRKAYYKQAEESKDEGIDSSGLKWLIADGPRQTFFRFVGALDEITFCGCWCYGFVFESIGMAPDFGHSWMDELINPFGLHFIQHRKKNPKGVEAHYWLQASKVLSHFYGRWSVVRNHRNAYVKAAFLLLRL